MTGKTSSKRLEGMSWVEIGQKSLVYLGNCKYFSTIVTRSLQGNDVTMKGQVRFQRFILSVVRGFT